ncbi:uncharacterized protein LTR77_008790 [Saxophila tyrrhenica]|uniref:Uncharacterized protein n=1 Tax=Saxophila tyrrhenica TaxID=1690608 RepID=A0AAV9P124_9PEZI|nr:hypothetical protein LTR77_008790 [Saxophila tyrrhenica]
MDLPQQATTVEQLVSSTIVLHSSSIVLLDSIKVSKYPSRSLQCQQTIAAGGSTIQLVHLHNTIFAHTGATARADEAVLTARPITVVTLNPHRHPRTPSPPPPISPLAPTIMEQISYDMSCKDEPEWAMIPNKEERKQQRADMREANKKMDDLDRAFEPTVPKEAAREEEGPDEMAPEKPKGLLSKLWRKAKDKLKKTASRAEEKMMGEHSGGQGA